MGVSTEITYYMNRIFRIVVPVLLVIAFLVAVAWAICAPDFEPAITSLALLASLIAIFADRWINLRERRKEFLRVLAHEMYLNIGVIKGLQEAKKEENIKTPHVYPRFYTTSLTSVISSGIFTGQEDKKLWKLMNVWLQLSTDFNNRLNISEIRVLSNPANAKAFNKKITEGKVAVKTISAFQKLLDLIMTNYKRESEIDYDTVLFEAE